MLDKNQHITFIYFIQYLVLIFFVISTIFLYINITDDYIREQLIITSSILYILWGIWHHIYDKKFSLKVILEYILIAITVIILSTYNLFV